MNDFATSRHLWRCSTPEDTFAILAIDHRDNLIADMAQARGKTVRYQDVVAFKRLVIQSIAPVASAVLTDPDYGFTAMQTRDMAQIGLIAPLEVTNYNVHPSQRQTVFIPNWHVEKIKRTGCDGVKLLLYYHPEAENAAAQMDIVDSIISDCQRYNIPFFLEPISYSLAPDRPLTSEERAQVVIETARSFARRGVDVLKLEFPLDVAQSPDETTWTPVLQQLAEVCIVPWVLLSGGVPFDVFLSQARAACLAGAAGVMVGRAVWGDGVGLEGDALAQFMQTTGRERMRQLTDVCARDGTAWTTQRQFSPLPEQWYHDI